ncbi:MAG: hypothetical protein H0U73_08095 [Tatlockia sp.]|nr:hypothetical protein [Tatlockia sp.]
MYDKIASRTNKILEETNKNFANIQQLVGEIIEKNANEDLDLAYIKKPIIEKKNLIQEQEKKQAPYMDSETKLYMAQAILPSPTYWNLIKQKTVESEKKIIKPFKDVTWYEPFSLREPKLPKNGSCPKEQEFVKIGSYVFTVNTALLGLNQSITNPNIFFLVSPNNGYLHKIPNNIRDNLEYEEKRNQYGKAYLADAINYVKLVVPPKTKISCIVLGDRYLPVKDSFEQENMDAYGAGWLLINKNEEEKKEEKQNLDPNLTNFDLWLKVNKEGDVQQNIKQKLNHYYLTKEDSKAEIDVNVYNLHALQHKLDLSPEDLETVYKIACDIQKKDGTGEAIIGHCQQGLDRTGMLIFALLLFANYEEFFSGKNCADKIYAAYKTLQWSRSPQALTKVADLVNAIYLAHALAAMDIAKNCRANLDNLIQNKKFRDSNQALILELEKAGSETEFKQLLDKELDKLNRMQNDSDSTGKNRLKRRPRSTSYPMQESASFNSVNSFKKSQSSPENLHENPENLEIKSETIIVNRQFYSSNGFFTNRPGKKLTDSLKDLNKPIQQEKNIIAETKDDNYFNSPLILPSISESTADDSQGKIENLELKSQDNIDLAPKNSGRFFERKLKNRHSESKETKVNPPKNYKSVLTCYRDAIEHQKNTEDALQNRIRIRDVIPSIVFTKEESPELGHGSIPCSDGFSSMNSMAS